MVRLKKPEWRREWRLLRAARMTAKLLVRHGLLLFKHGVQGEVNICIRVCYSCKKDR